MIGIDIGYGYVKSYNGTHGDIFPSAVAQAISTQYSQEEVIAVNGAKFFVGDTALRERVYLYDIRVRDFILSEPWTALLCSALHRRGVHGGVLVLGIPPGHYTKEIAAEMTDKVHKTCFIVHGVNGAPKTIATSFDKVKVVPQGGGVFFDYMFDRRTIGNIANIAVIDIGHQTLDLVFFEGNRYVESAAVSYPMGVSVVLDRIRRQVSLEHKVNLQNTEAEKALRTGKLSIYGKEYDIRDLLDRELEGFTGNVRSLITKHIEDLGARVETILVAGGGANLLKSSFQKYSYIVPAEPQFANARGYYKYAKII